MILKPVTSEKAVKLIELDNTLLFEAPRNARRDEIKKEVEKVFDVRVKEVRTLIKLNKKVAYVRLQKESLAIDVATKLGMI
jgi:large subunit ribosomal protein L23